MLDAEQNPFELTELDAPEEELLGRYLPIGDVAKSIGVNPSVLRFWEQEFPQLRPTKRGNRRYYCSEDVALIRTIQHLLYEEHYTILGARNKIHELQIQNKVKGILDDKKSAPLQVKPKNEVKIDEVLKELKAIRSLLFTPNMQERERQAKLAKEKAQLEAVENFSLVSEDASELMAKNEETTKEAQSGKEKTESISETEEVAPHSYDLGALGAEGDDFLSFTPKAEAAPQAENESVKEPKPAAEEVPAAPQKPATTEEKAPSTESKPATHKVDTSHLAVPPLPNQHQGFTIGMNVHKTHPGSLTYGSQMVWKKK